MGIKVPSITTKACLPAWPPLVRGPAWGTRGQQGHDLGRIPPRGRGAHSKPGCKLGECLALAQVGQHQQRLPPRVELAPARPNLPAVTPDDPGGVSERLGRQRQRGRVESIEAPWWQKRILVDRFIYQGLHYVPSRHAAQVRTYAESLQDQDEKGSMYAYRHHVSMNIWPGAEPLPRDRLQHRQFGAVVR